MGGAVGVDSEVGHGSTFWFEIDLMVQPEDAKAEPEVTEGLGPFDILVVDDAATNRQVVAGLLAFSGHRVVGASSGEEALDMVASRPFDLVLMDVRMPGLDGFETTRRLRRMADPAKARIPVVAVTGGAQSEEAALCFAAGMNDFVAKPVTVSALEAAIRRVVRAKGGDAVEPAVPGQEGEFDESKLRRLRVALGPLRIGEVVSEFRRSLEDDRKSIGEAWGRRDFARLAFLAHRAGGAAVDIGCFGLGALLERVETAAKAERADAVEREIAALDETLKRALAAVEASHAAMGRDVSAY
jgi:CheY-like chemotaxis protein